MKSIDSFIVSPVNNKRYDNEVKIGDVDFLVSVEQDDHRATNRLAEVISVPLEYNGPIQQGDIIVVHHNVFRIMGDMKGVKRSSRNFLKENLFMVPMYETFMYRRPDGDWRAISPFCFVEPIYDEYKKEVPLNGIMVYPNDEQNHIVPGTLVGFRPESEYEFHIEGKRYYRMKTNMICLIGDKK